MRCVEPIPQPTFRLVLCLHRRKFACIVVYVYCYTWHSSVLLCICSVHEVYMKVTLVGCKCESCRHYDIC
jgi:hypothetical protein